MRFALTGPDCMSIQAESGNLHALFVPAYTQNVLFPV
jgi:hypothetical protein